MSTKMYARDPGFITPGKTYSTKPTDTAKIIPSGEVSRKEVDAKLTDLGKSLESLQQKVYDTVRDSIGKGRSKAGKDKHFCPWS